MMVPMTVGEPKECDTQVTDCSKDVAHCWIWLDEKNLVE